MKNFKDIYTLQKIFHRLGEIILFHARVVFKSQNLDVILNIGFNGY